MNGDTNVDVHLHSFFLLLCWCGNRFNHFPGGATTLGGYGTPMSSGGTPFRSVRLNLINAGIAGIVNHRWWRERAIVQQRRVIDRRRKSV